jgi:hypothetical protein
MARRTLEPFVYFHHHPLTLIVCLFAILTPSAYDSRAQVRLSTITVLALSFSLDTGT